MFANTFSRSWLVPTALLWPPPLEVTLGPWTSASSPCLFQRTKIFHLLLYPQNTLMDLRLCRGLLGIFEARGVPYFLPDRHGSMIVDRSRIFEHPVLQRKGRRQKVDVKGIATVHPSLCNYCYKAHRCLIVNIWKVMWPTIQLHCIF